MIAIIWKLPGCMLPSWIFLRLLFTLCGTVCLAACACPYTLTVCWHSDYRAAGTHWPSLHPAFTRLISSCSKSERGILIENHWSAVCLDIASHKGADKLSLCVGNVCCGGDWSMVFHNLFFFFPQEPIHTDWLDHMSQLYPPKSRLSSVSTWTCLTVRSNLSAVT